MWHTEPEQLKEITDDAFVPDTTAVSGGQSKGSPEVQTQHERALYITRMSLARQELNNVTYNSK